jgi:hypothetical protein
MKETTRIVPVPGVSIDDRDKTGTVLHEFATRLSRTIGIGTTVRGYMVVIPSGEGSVKVTVNCRDEDGPEAAAKLMLA